MNIFICWSGDRSRALAKELQTYLPQLIPGLVKQAGDKNLFVSDDIAKGARWFDAVEVELDKADAGLVCITREALQSGWIHFEAGALARAVRKNHTRGKGQSGTLYTYLLGVEPNELKGPLSEFQSTRFEREDTKRLCMAIVTTMTQDAPGRDDWEKAFDQFWPLFEARVKTIPPLAASKLIPDLEEIFHRKTFNEPLEECTRQAWIDRFTGAQETIAGLKAYGPAMKADNTYIVDLYNELIAQLDAYAMNMGALLLKEERFPISYEDGKLEIGKGIKRACESRRARIRQLVTHLLAPNCAPVLEEQSRRYAKLPSFDTKKTLLIHPSEWAIQNGNYKDHVTEDQLEHCAESLWEFDRIYFYLVQEILAKPDIALLLKCIEREFEKAWAVDGSSGLIPLHYSLRALKKTLKQVRSASLCDEMCSEAGGLLTKIEAFINDYDLDKGHQVRDNIQELRLLLGDR